MFRRQFLLTFLLAFTSAATVLFHSDFETGEAFLQRKLKPGHKSVFLIPNDKLSQWPLSGGYGIVEGDSPESMEVFQYEERESNRLLRVKGITRPHARGALIQTGNLLEWPQASFGMPELVKDQKMFGHHSARFDCRTDSARKMVKAFVSRQDTLHCRFYLCLERNLEFGPGYQELPIAFMRHKGRSIPDICIAHDKTTGKQVFAFPQAPPKSWSAVREESAGLERIPVLPGSLYCVEYKAGFSPTNHCFLELRVNGNLQAKQFVVAVPDTVPASHFALGKLSWPGLKGSFRIDEVVLSDAPVGAIPAKPTVVFDGHVFSSSPFRDLISHSSHIASHWQIVIAGAWLTPLFNSGEYKHSLTTLKFPHVISLEEGTYGHFYFDGTIHVPTPLKPGEDFAARLRHKNTQGNWSEWSHSVSFRSPAKRPSAPEPTSSLPLLKDAWFTEPGRRRPSRLIERGKWYDLHLRFDGMGVNPFSKPLAHVDIYLCGKPDAFEGNYRNRGGPFRARDNYTISLSLGHRRVYTKEVEGTELSTNLTGIKGLYCDASNGSFELAREKGQARIRWRVLDKAVTGPWNMITYVQSYRTGISPMRCDLFHVVDKGDGVPSASPGWKFVIIATLGFAILTLGYWAGKRRGSHSPPARPATPSPEKQAEDMPGSLDHRTQMAVDFIKENYKRPISTREVAKAMNISANRLGVIFREQTSKTVVEYIGELRIAEAKSLLKSTTLNITEIAYKSGYKTLANFERAFVLETRKTPSQFRKSS